VSKLTVNTGSSANFGDGTPLRTAFQYINSNFNELYANALISNNVTVGNASVNATMNSTSFSGTSLRKPVAPTGSTPSRSWASTLAAKSIVSPT